MISIAMTIELSTSQNKNIFQSSCNLVQTKSTENACLQAGRLPERVPAVSGRAGGQAGFVADAGSRVRRGHHRRLHHPDQLQNRTAQSAPVPAGCLPAVFRPAEVLCPVQDEGSERAFADERARGVAVLQLPTARGSV
uniref:(northern house mosquito) hypothetical protein n=1 Tax=Culex pipiens TaxID=7175 RepID=A0A8D8AC54_CULPI